MAPIQILIDLIQSPKIPQNVQYFWFGPKPLPKLSLIEEGIFGFIEKDFNWP